MSRKGAPRASEALCVLKPQNSQLWYQTVNDWVDRWTAAK